MTQIILSYKPCGRRNRNHCLTFTGNISPPVSTRYQLTYHTSAYNYKTTTTAAATVAAITTTTNTINTITYSRLHCFSQKVIPHTSYLIPMGWQQASNAEASSKSLPIQNIHRLLEDRVWGVWNSLSLWFPEIDYSCMIIKRLLKWHLFNIYFQYSLSELVTLFRWILYCQMAWLDTPLKM